MELTIPKWFRKPAAYPSYIRGAFECTFANTEGIELGSARVQIVEWRNLGRTVGKSHGDGDFSAW